MKLSKLCRCCAVGILLSSTCLGMLKQIPSKSKQSMCEALGFPKDHQNQGTDARIFINEKIDYLAEKLNLNAEPPVYPSVRAKIAQICRTLGIPCIYKGADKIFSDAARIEAEKKCTKAGLRYLYEGSDVNEILFQISDIYLKLEKHFSVPEFLLDELIRINKKLHDSMWFWMNIWFPSLTEDVLKGYLDGTKFLPPYAKQYSDGIIFIKRFNEKRMYIGVNEARRISCLLIPFMGNSQNGAAYGSSDLFLMKNKSNWEINIPIHSSCILPFYMDSMVMSILESSENISGDALIIFNPLYYHDGLFLTVAPDANTNCAYQESRRWVASMYPADLSEVKRVGRYKFFRRMSADGTDMLFKYDRNWCLLVSKNSFGWVYRVEIYQPNFEANEINFCRYFLERLSKAEYEYNGHTISTVLCSGGLKMNAEYNISTRYLYVSGLNMNVHFVDPLRNIQLQSELQNSLGKNALKILKKLEN